MSKSTDSNGGSFEPGGDYTVTGDWNFEGAVTLPADTQGLPAAANQTLDTTSSVAFAEVTATVLRSGAGTQPTAGDLRTHSSSWQWVMRNAGETADLTVITLENDEIKIGDAGGSDRGLIIIDETGVISLASKNGVSGLTLSETGGITANTFIQGVAQEEPAAPGAFFYRLYLGLNGGTGKLELRVRFPTGATQVIATEP